MMLESASGGSVLTMSAAVAPDCDMRMSSGPSRRNEKPRAASSICIEETPMSITTPSTAAMPCSSTSRSMSPKRPSTQDQPAGMGLGQGAAGGNGMGVAVDGDHPAVGGGEDRPAVAAGAEGAVDIEAAIAGRERLQHLVEHDRHMRRFGGSVIDGHGAENQGEQGVKIHADNAHGSLNKWFQI